MTRAVWNCKIYFMDKLVFERGVRVSHAYIVASMSEETRREAALRVAAAMLCESGGDRPCGECRHCRKVFSGIHPDVVNIAPGVDDKGRKRREILVDQVRFVSADAQVMPNEAGVKVYVIHDADLMNPAAQNALLKLLEEPPASAAFVLCASNPALLLPTVRSRCALLRLNADAQADEQAVQDAQALLEAAASGSRVELLRWSGAAEGMDTRRAAAMMNAARGRLADILRGTAGPELSPEYCARLDALFQKCSAMLKLNTGVRHVLGLIAVSGVQNKK